ncbi:hypothetical protein [Spiroplasma monobiae]|uniref:Uncharacterized protein n=1 Tax=Spiroplasma monobiae MQ-1 TaxID=1336748 RepID=A0A2K9LUI2_SPISQ|nr:hypothetical protein [Spiroplasma monobiae]AUM62706.1 hypothetical protein SMONO_v1c04570 [Spiroplasma monobiae MQ-1]
MLKLLSLIGSLSLTSSAILPLSQTIINVNNRVNQEYDISALNATKIERTYNYYQDVLYNFYISARGNAASMIKKASGIDVGIDDVEVLSAFNINENRELNDDDVMGQYGAGKTYVNVRIAPTESGIEKGIYGEMYYIYTITHQSLDLAIFENRFTNELVYLVWTVEEIIWQLWWSIWKGIGDYKEYPTFVHPETLGAPKLPTKISDGTPFTQRDLIFMEPGTRIALSTVFYATEEGKSRGVTGSFQVNFVYVKTYICCD